MRHIIASQIFKAGWRRDGSDGLAATRTVHIPDVNGRDLGVTAYTERCTDPTALTQVEVGNRLLDLDQARELCVALAAVIAVAGGEHPVASDPEQVAAAVLRHLPLQVRPAELTAAVTR